MYCVEFYFYFIMKFINNSTIYTKYKTKELITTTNKITTHPIAFPIFLCLPCLVSGIPIFLDSFPFIPDKPRARFGEKENPCFLPI